MEHTSLLKQRDFRLFWGAQSVSMFGINMGRTAIPLLAAVVLGATPLQMGLLQAAQTVAYLVVGLPAGALIDRMRRRNILIVSDASRAGFTLLLVALFIFNWVTFPVLIVLVLVIGVATTFFEIAYQSYIPALVGREKLMDGNSKLESTNSASRMVGPAVGGVLVEVSASLAMAVQTISHALSAALLLSLRKPEPSPQRTGERRMATEIKAGLRLVVGHPLIRAVVGSATTYNLFYSASLPLITLLLVDELRLPGTTAGLLLAVGGIGGVAGAAVAGLAARRLGPVRVTWLSYLLTVPTFLLAPFAQQGAGLALFAVPWFVLGFGIVVYNVGAVSIRQALCPDHLLGRMNASVRFMVWGIMPAGALIGGALGEVIGVRAALFVSAAGMLAGGLWLLLSPLRTMRVLPQPDHPTPSPSAGPAPVSAATASAAPGRNPSGGPAEPAPRQRIDE